MPTSSRLRRWAFVHKWTSLISTLFLLVICVSGLPLIFSDEIEGWLEPYSFADMPEDTPNVSLDELTAQTRMLYRNHVVVSIYLDDKAPQAYVRAAPSFAELKADPGVERLARFDLRSGDLIERSDPVDGEPTTFMGVMLRLHTDLFAGFFGEMFLALMGALFVAAIVSGVVLYGPFMRRLSFGEVRADRASRLKWLDLHNLLGAVTLVWAFALGVTGVLNEFAAPLYALWRSAEVEPRLAAWTAGAPPPSPAEIVSAESAYQTAAAAAPGMKISSVDFPGSQYASPYHYVFWAKGATPLTARLYSPVLVDARTGALAAAPPPPWYLRALDLSRPLHFGDYGGAPLKVVWALLDLATIVVLGSGLYLWFGRRRRAVPAAVPAAPALAPSAAE
ncbi:PepSY-associated TM helix domain-containing protein [Methylocella sp.]|uniref:PepSY-associated TM helix domain-containing protein n=1 Tax=Methylocella sp. TaxID=1978226 RepID=UPI0035B04683